MKVLIISFLTILYISSFSQTNKIVRNGEPDIYNIDSDDKEMNEAIKKSRQTFSNFIQAINNKKNNFDNYSVKMPFITTDNSIEHIWLVNISFKEKKLYGKIGNLPENVNTVKEGDIVEIKKEKISDWFYIDHAKLIGGLTIKLLRNRMTKMEREQFDKSIDFSIE